MQIIPFAEIESRLARGWSLDKVLDDGDTVITLVPPAEGSSLDAALQYADLGWPVLPLNGKVPRTAKGVKDASTDPAWIRKRFARGENVGIACGVRSGLVVLDVDPRNGGEATLRALVAQHGALPATIAVKTGGGGLHFYFQHPGGRLKGKIGPGLDVKGEGGYVVAPPSIHPDTREPYEWTAVGEVLPLPAWLLGLMTDVDRQPEASVPIIMGGRNDTLFSLGGALKRGGKTRDEIVQVLLEENALRCRPPLPDEEVVEIARKVAGFETAPQSFKTQWQAAVLHSADLSLANKAVLLGLSLYMDADCRNCWPTMRTLATELKCGKATVERAIEVAVSLGLLQVYRRPARRTWTNGYVGALPEIASPPQQAERRGD